MQGRTGTRAPVSSRDSIAGLLILAMIVLSLLHDLVGRSGVSIYYLLAGCCSWLAVLLLVSRVNVFQKTQACVIGLAGLVLLVLSARAGSDVQWGSAIGKNASLVSMIASVGFLRLIALSDETEDPLPVGAAAYYKTLFGVGIFGSVINISAPILFADRLHAEQRLSRLASVSITRVFSGCSAWSPFFGGMAAVLLYVPGFDLGRVMMVCFPFALAGFIVVCLETWLLRRRALQEFRGYPVRFGSLWIPFLLSTMVMSLSVLMPAWSILTCISLSSLLLTLVVLLLRYQSSGLSIIKRHVEVQLPRMGSELFLFLVAGLLAQGLAGYLTGVHWSIAEITFGPLQASLLLLGIILVGIIGIHPIVTVAGLTPLLLTMDTNVHMLAVTYLFAWSLGTSASPLSGTHLVFQGRYGISSWRGAMWNWPYVVVMYAVAVPMLFVVSTFV